MRRACELSQTVARGISAAHDIGLIVKTLETINRTKYFLLYQRAIGVFYGDQCWCDKTAIWTGRGQAVHPATAPDRNTSPG
jgi:hypothetical protein